MPFKAFLADISKEGFDVRTFPAAGRRYITMDRDDANWAMVEKGWKTHIAGEARSLPTDGRRERLACRHPGTIDRDLPEFVITDNGPADRLHRDSDAVVLFNFRGDRAIEITRAFVEAESDKFDRIRR